MLQYVRRLQGTNKVKGASLTVTIPYPITQILELSKVDNIILELARDKDETIIVLRKMQTKEIDSKTTI
jgi:bifunctional DNA-binding transcriptional regulator/antitoxin component of YhaV-PrlF toxin-antitoxin module